MLEYLKLLEGEIDLQPLIKIKTEKEANLNRENYKKYHDAINSLPPVNSSKIDLQSDKISVSSPSIPANELSAISQSLEQLIPWRKGPFELFGIDVDTEWRSDLKWNRIKDHLGDLTDKTVLDIGCNNGYFLFKLANLNPKLAIGIDPVPHVYFQFQFLKHFFKSKQVQFELFGIEDLSRFSNAFDCILNMGIIYHHRHPIQQLLDCKRALKLGGEIILETIGIPGDESTALFPPERYANMKNIWFIPTLSCLINWAKKAKFDDIEVISDTLLTSEEQRLTKWCPPPHQSLDDFLDPKDSSKTIEGLPAPRRFCIKAKKLKKD